MPASKLDQLRQLSDVVLETADLSLIRSVRPHHVNLSAARITTAAQLEEHAALIDEALGWARRQVGKGGNRKLAAMRAVERLSVVFAHHVAAAIEGRVSIELDGRLAFQKRATLERARTTVEQLGEAGVPGERVLLKLPATWEGIQAAAKLEQEGVHCHLTLVFGSHQVAAAADAGVTVLSPAVGRITDWHRKNDGVDRYEASADPGVLTTKQMHRYLAARGYGTQLMPGTFRGIDQVLALAGCALLSIPPKLLELLETPADDVSRQLPDDGDADEVPTIDAATFQKLHAADPVANAKLSQGVKNASWALVNQENQLAEWIATRQDRAALTSAAALFRVWDYDGDGYIDREEWGGTDEVFNALDRNNDGRLSLDEMALGLGAPYEPEP